MSTTNSMSKTIDFLLSRNILGKSDVEEVMHGNFCRYFLKVAWCALKPSSQQALVRIFRFKKEARVPSFAIEELVASGFIENENFSMSPEVEELVRYHSESGAFDSCLNQQDTQKEPKDDNRNE